MSMPINDATDVLEALNERVQNERLFQRWIPIQGEMSFDDFKSEVMSKASKADNRPAEVILAGVRDILKQVKGD